MLNATNFTSGTNVTMKWNKYQEHTLTPGYYDIPYRYRIWFILDNENIVSLIKEMLLKSIQIQIQNNIAPIFCINVVILKPILYNDDHSYFDIFYKVKNK